MPTEAIHSWEAVTETHLRNMNLAIARFLSPGSPAGRAKLNGSHGIRVGLNSSIRHLILGKATRTSAGASVPHVHKQLWGMPPGSVNLGDHLAKVCTDAAAEGIDYLACYLAALEQADLVLWSDENVALYVPMAQISVHELQAIMKRRHTRHFLELSESELRSLSRAEAIVTKLYSSIGINSFNEVILSQSFDANENNGFRLVATFITREVDLAVSELNLLYVVDKHPSDTLAETKQRMPEILQSLDR
jgi:galactose-1-phosphate uridylyltransferase